METEEKDDIKIVIASGAYRETYAPLPRDPNQADDKVKRGILKSLGMPDEEIDKVVDGLELEFDEGVDGSFDDGPYTPVNLVKIIHREPPTIEIPEPEPDPKPGPEPEEVEKEPDPEIQEEPEKDETLAPRQTMLQQYYGDRKAEASRRKIFSRFKSHVVQKSIDVYDEDGTKRQVDVYTVEGYPEKEQDADELLLEGYQTRLERLSRAHQGDVTPYKREVERMKSDTMAEIMDKYEEMHEVDPDKAEDFKALAMKYMEQFSKPDFEKNAIQALIDRDTEFIETNNYTYNARQNTAENLKTLGKFGERSVKAPVSKDQPFAQKFGLKTMNALIEVRNHTTAPIHKAIGTYVASPVFRKIFGVTQAKSKEPVEVNGYYITPMEDMLATSQKNSKGMFTNKPSHRYHARKDYFINQERMSEQENQEPGKAKRTSLGKLMRMAIVPRVKAVVNYKEGNIAILNAGLADIEQAIDERESQKEYKEERKAKNLQKIESYKHEAKELETLIKVTKDPVEKAKVERMLEQRKARAMQLEARAETLDKMEIDSISTDALSMSQHDKANKATVTAVVKGVKTAGRTAAGIFISKYLYREIVHQTETPGHVKHIPREVPVEKKTTVPGMDEQGVSEITLEDIYSQGTSQLSYSAPNGGNLVADNTSYFRGLAFEYQGKVISGSDGKGFDPTVLTNVKIDQELNSDTSVVSVMQEILQDYTGKTFSTDEVSKMLMNGDIKGVNIWRSTLETGTPTGWFDKTDDITELINGGSHTIVETITEMVDTPVWIPGTTSTYTTIGLNPPAVAAEIALGIGEIGDYNDAFRFTRSQESIERRSNKDLAKMEKENGRDDKAKKHADKVKKRREIKSFQRSNKRKTRKYTHVSQRMQDATREASEEGKEVTVFERFTGTKRGDFKSRIR